MKALFGIIAIAIVVLTLVFALLISAVSSILGPFVADDRNLDFDEYHHHPDNDL